MEGLAKTAEPQVTNHSPNSDPNEHLSKDAAAWAGVPMQVYRFFGVDFAKADPKTLTQLAEVYKYIDRGLDKRTPGRVLEKLSNLEVRLGAPKLGQTRHGRIWDWLKMGEVIKDVRRAQKAFEK